MKKAFVVILMALLVTAVFVSCDDSEHEHLYSTEWKSDGTNHWHECECGEKTDVAEHIWNNGEETKAATCTEKGVKTYTCTICEAIKTEEIATKEHTLDSDYLCSSCGNYFYPSVATMNEKAKRKDIINKTVTVTVGTVEYALNTYTGESGALGTNTKTFFIGNTELNSYSQKALQDGEKATFIFRDGTITSSATGYTNINTRGDDTVYMLLPGNTDVVFENITFNGVVSFTCQFYNSYVYLGSITFKNCTFNGLVIGYARAYEYTFDGCTFNNYTNATAANGSNPVYLSTNTINNGAEKMPLQKFTFINNEVHGSIPVKLDCVGRCESEQKYTPVITVLDNYFDISYQYKDGATDNRKMGFMIRPLTDSTYFTLYDDGNTKSDGTTAIYTVDDDQTSFFNTKGIKILDRNGSPKEINALVYKSADSWQTLKSID